MRLFCLGVPVDNICVKEAIDIAKNYLRHNKQHYIVTPNPEIIIMAQEDIEFRNALLGASLSLPDGIGLKLALFFAGYHLKERITGADFLNYCFISLPSQTKYFLLGGEGGVTAKAAAKARQLYDANVVGAFEPDRGVYDFTKEIKIADEGAHQILIKKINEASPDVLVVALGHGQQEKWLNKFMPLCRQVKVGIGVGGSLDYLGGRITRAPLFARRLGLEWLWRLAKEPKRWYRIFTATVIFPTKALGWLVRLKFKYRPAIVGCVINRQGRILIVRRVGPDNHWQLPQGGREENESLSSAVLREMGEEINLINLTIIGQSKENVYKYRWAKNHFFARGRDDNDRASYYGYAGQSLTVFYLRHDGRDNEVKVDNHELASYKWIPLSRLIESVHPVRRPLAKIILTDAGRLGLAPNATNTKA